MTDIQLVQSSKKKHKKDGKDRKRDDRDIDTGDLAVTEGEKKRKERREEREGAHSLSHLLFQRADSVYVHTVVEVKNGKKMKTSTAILADEPGACHAHP